MRILPLVAIAALSFSHSAFAVFGYPKTIVNDGLLAVTNPKVLLANADLNKIDYSIPYNEYVYEGRDEVIYFAKIAFLSERIKQNKADATDIIYSVNNLTDAYESARYDSIKQSQLENYVYSDIIPAVRNKYPLYKKTINLDFGPYDQATELGAIKVDLGYYDSSKGLYTAMINANKGYFTYSLYSYGLLNDCFSGFKMNPEIANQIKTLESQNNLATVSAVGYYLTPRLYNLHEDKRKLRYLHPLPIYVSIAFFDNQTRQVIYSNAIKVKYNKSIKEMQKPTIVTDGFDPNQVRCHSYEDLGSGLEFVQQTWQEKIKVDSMQFN
ncbi:hypothetical protein [Moraxella pluranimalium]|uniref:Uncharacterized protein n=1 Tax=Moraxella pluranimalium TaxID=470453 RepID=A0A1T0CTJ9_9GAMM|nr:hypothetical protein [Moraxella pluranimalium]OOS25673.1 hypothetical protein B0680_02285 [Moraxella pluranimalium]